MNKVLKKLLFQFLKKVKAFYDEERQARLEKMYNLKDVILESGFIDGNVEIGKHTYLNDGYRIVTGSKSKISIGKHCAIGRNFMCASRTHDKSRPTSDDKHKVHKKKEADISIGEGVWIGDNVIVREGVTIQNYAIVGANSVVTKDVDSFEIVGGVPIKHIAYNREHYKYKGNKPA